MKLLCNGKTLCSDEPKCDKISSFEIFVVDRKIITHRI